MTDQMNEQPSADNSPEELAVLKERAKVLGLSFSPNIGIATLRERIAEKLGATEEAPAAEAPAVVAPAPGNARQQIYREAMKLVRVRIQNLDPKKKDLKGEIICVGNEYIGTVKKFVPFGEGSDEGWHLPNIIYQHLKSRKFLETKLNKRPDGREQLSTRWVREYALELLPPLTQAELNKLATAQMAEGIVETTDALN
jgi:hypothetical protein